MKPFGNENIILYDNHILAVNKPAGIVTQPDLSELAKAWVKGKFSKPGSVFLEPIHRLDKPTAGIVLFARTSKALSRLQEQMRSRQIEKIYHAWIEGSLKEQTGVIRHCLQHCSFHTRVSREGKEAILEYRVLKHYKGMSYLQIRLQTGRYHQIRAQMAAMGCPVVGDQKYGSCRRWKQGIALCAVKLAFKHPVTQEPVSISCSDPLLDLTDLLCN